MNCLIYLYVPVSPTSVEIDTFLVFIIAKKVI